jgi:hypothetical protein
MRRASALGALAVLWTGATAVLGSGAVPCAAAAGEVRVAVVVDFGTESGAPPPGAVCVAVEDRSNGAAVLQARARQLGTPEPRFDGSGFLCAIDGWPESGCGERTDSGYRYWSYWKGSTDGWAYSQVGPTGSRANEAVTEGWRFLDGAGTGTDTDDPPRGSARAADTCAAPATTTRVAVATTAGATATVPSTAVPATDAVTTTTAAAIDSRATASSTSFASPTTIVGIVREGADGDEDVAFPAGLVIGGIAIAGIGAGALLQARKRSPR